jgi:hypothetical protein
VIRLSAKYGNLRNAKFPLIQFFLHGTADRISGCWRMAMSQRDRR